MAGMGRFSGLRVGLLGGSFNPAHDGHRHISLVALRRLQLDQIWWLVSPQNPLKSATDMADLPTRLSAARRIARHPRIHVSDLETRLGTQYTCDTLAALRIRAPDTRFVWLMGADNLAQMPAWRHWRQIMALMPVAVLDRPGYGLRALHGKVATGYANARIASACAASLADMPAPAWCFLSCRLHPASATAIRAGEESATLSLR